MANQIAVSDEALLYAMLPYETVFEYVAQGDDEWMARNPELGLMAHAPTREEALGTLTVTRCEWIQVLMNDKQPIPLPSSFATFMNDKGETVFLQAHARPARCIERK